MGGGGGKTDYYIVPPLEVDVGDGDLLVVALVGHLPGPVGHKRQDSKAPVHDVLHSPRESVQHM